MLVLPESSKAVLITASSKSDARRVNNGKITMGYPSLVPSFEGILFSQRHEICSQATRGSRLSYGENPESLFRLGLNRYRVVTNGEADGRTELR